ncbi:13149_t:CDS:1, partial [Entrophospora sp. SA101]
EEKKLSENSMSNRELILIIQSLIGSLNETNCPQFKGLASKKKEELLLIVQQIKDIHNVTDN